MRYKVSIAAALCVAALSSFAYAQYVSNLRTPTQFHPGHSHQGDETIGAPQHSGGTDAYGCHNASVPYHCH